MGNHDPLHIPGPGDDPGPVLSLLRFRRFDHVVLCITRSEYAERAGVIRDAARDSSGGPTFSFMDIELQSVVDYEEIYRTLSRSLAQVLPSLPYREMRNYVLLDPGTPQMQTVWFLMVQSGGFPAVLLQGVPPRFGGGHYRCRDVRLDPARFPVKITLRPHDKQDESAATEGPAGRDDAWTMVRPEIVGKSPAMGHLLERTNRAARFDDAVVCITGETGTGKELVARHIHDRSRRRGEAFIPVNSAALPEGLVESALFGHKKGAFTGAVADRPGAFRSARGGTLFLDEVGELPMPVQAALLRVIDQREITPVGYDKPVHVDVRIIVATNRDLGSMVEEGTFRADLYERLRQLPVHLPPLRDRAGDVELLAGTFLNRWNLEHDTQYELSPEAIAVLAGYSWPRNVRQLQNTVRQLCSYAETDVIDAAEVQEILYDGDVPGTAGGPEPTSPVSPAPSPSTMWTGDTPVDVTDILLDTERAWYAEALRRADGNKAEAARLLGLKPPAFRKALRERYPDLL